MANRVTIRRFAELTGYTQDAVRTKIKNGVRLFNRHYKKAPDGRVLMSLKEYEKWVEGKAA